MWLYCACTRIFLPGVGSTWWSWHHLVMSLLFCLHRGLGVIKGEHTWASGLSSGFLVAAHSVTLHEEPQTLSCSYLGASWGVRLQPYREVFYICSPVSAQGYLGHPELVYLSCLWVNQVSHHPASLRPITRVARTAIIWCKLVHGINHNFDKPTNPVSIPIFSHSIWHPWVGSKRSGRISYVWFSSVELWQCMTVP